MATPQVPPRPVRHQHPAQPSSGANFMVPQVPPRPAGRRGDRSISPGRDAFAPSPLNDSPFPIIPGDKHSDSNSRVYGPDAMSPPMRPPSVTLPSIGQEGSEYADIGGEEAEAPLSRTTSNAPQQTSTVGSDLPLHAPKPSLSQSDAKARISNVTRTDSSQAPAAGYGRRLSVQLDDKDPHSRALRSRTSASLRSPSSASTERPGSAQPDNEQGIPEIGRQVPMYPNAGDVQAPSPAPHASPYPGGIGFHNDGSRPRHHNRTRSGREVFHAPPDSYGLHGHGVTPANVSKFEKSWYDKHPEAQARDEGQYSPALRDARSDFVLSSEDLNRLVRDTAAKGAGFGTSPNVVGLPDEQIGYLASDEYTSRMTSPRPGSGYFKPHSSSSQTHADSPLRKSSFPVNVMEQQQKSADAAKQPAEKPASSEEVIEEPNEEGVIHVDEPLSATGFDRASEDEGLRRMSVDASGSYVEERGYDAPILASDEHRPEQMYLHPAVSPVAFQREDADGGYRSASNSRPASRPASRPGSIAGVPGGLSRYLSHEEVDTHTPLEDVEEYEPLFEEDDEASEKKPKTQVQRLKHRPERARFPSKDIWEDSPEHAQLMAEVKTPEPQPAPVRAGEQGTPSVFEPPETEAARKGEVGEDEKAKLVPREERLRQSNFQPHIRQEMGRPGLAQRFPSRDIWEDSPDHAQLSATVGEQSQENEPPKNAPLDASAVVQTGFSREGATAGAAAVPTVPARPSKPTAHAGNASGQPQVSARPQKSQLSQVYSAIPPADEEPAPTDAKRSPPIPDRPRPQVPARPAKKLSQDTEEQTAAADSASDEPSARAPPPAPKPKPAVPARPVGAKIAALQGSFISDLNNRLKLGQAPPRPKPQEKAAEEESTPAVEDKAPLADARKERARGPARRKPAAAVTSSPEEGKAKTVHFSIVEPSTIWEIRDDGALRVSSQRIPLKPSSPSSTAAAADPEPTSSAVPDPEPAAAPENKLPSETAAEVPSTKWEGTHVVQCPPAQSEPEPTSHVVPDPSGANMDEAGADVTSASTEAMPKSEAYSAALLGDDAAPPPASAATGTGATDAGTSDASAKPSLRAKNGGNVVVKEGEVAEGLEGEEEAVEKVTEASS